MKLVIFAGGLGTRISEESDYIPKPMVKIGKYTILEHIINYYRHFGIENFIIAAGYKSKIIKDFFRKKKINYNVKVIDTGLNTLTGLRIKRIEKYITGKQFLLTYGDGLSNVDLNQLLDHHRRFKKIATVTAVRPPARFGSIDISNGVVTRFAEKDPQDTGWINGGFFCLNKEICSFIMDLTTSFESEPLNHLVSIKQLSAFEHHGWWQPMDTLRDKRTLESIWEKGDAPWLIA